MSVFEPTSEQKELLSIAESALVIAGPGTGKTRTAIERARLFVPSLVSSAHKILFLSFSNAAIYRLMEGAKAELASYERRQIHFRTYHAMAAEILYGYGRYIGLPPNPRVMDRLEETLLIIEEGIPNSPEEYERFLERKATIGLLGFSTLVPLATRVLKLSERLRMIYGRCYPLIVVDEFQDTSQEQWDFLKEIGQYSQVISFGDPNQIIFASSYAATERRFNEFLEWKSARLISFRERYFRFGSPEILVFAECLLKGNEYTPKENSGVHFRDLEYRDRGNNNRLRTTLALIWKRIRENEHVGKNMVFLAPSNRIADEIAYFLRNPPRDVAAGFPVYARLSRDEAACDAVMLSLAALQDFAKNPSEISCKKAIVALMTMNALWYNKANLSSQRLRELARYLMQSISSGSKLGNFLSKLSMSDSIAEHMLELLEIFSDISGFKSCCTRIAACGKISFTTTCKSVADLSLFDVLLSSRAPKGLEGYDVGKGFTHICNYHKAKGKEFDYVVMIIDPRGESSKTDIEELRRLYYVCATRAKEILLVLYYGKDKGRVLKGVI